MNRTKRPQFFATIRIWISGPSYSMAHDVRRVSGSGPYRSAESAWDAAERYSGDLHREAMVKKRDHLIHFQPGFEVA